MGGLATWRWVHGAMPWLAGLGWVPLLALMSGCAPRAGTAASPEDASDARDDELERSLASLSDDERARLRAYMRAIEARARNRNMEVIWVNPPDLEAVRDVDRLRAMLRRRP